MNHEFIIEDARPLSNLKIKHFLTLKKEMLLILYLNL